MLVLFPQWKFYFWSYATLSIYFYQKLDKISSPLLKLRRKTFPSQFHCSHISFKLCTCVCQTLRRTNYYFNWYAVNKEATSHGKFLIIMKYTKSPTQNVAVVSRKSNYHCSPRNRNIMQRWSSFSLRIKEVSLV